VTEGIRQQTTMMSCREPSEQGPAGGSNKKKKSGLRGKNNYGRAVGAICQKRESFI
jgi:hypothetical protein